MTNRPGGGPSGCQFCVVSSTICCMAGVAITCIDEQDGQPYVKAVGAHAQTQVVTPQCLSVSTKSLMDGLGGLLLTGGPDVDPVRYGGGLDPKVGLEFSTELDTLEHGLLQYALEQDMPVLAICRGMQLLNVAFGGSLLQNIPSHREELKDGFWEPVRHPIYLSPGSKLAAILGMGGFFRVNSLHHQGLREAQKSPRLLASAYSPEDAIIEALESPEHSWVVGVQCHPELSEQVPKVFGNLFAAFAERAEAYAYGQ